MLARPQNEQQGERADDAPGQQLPQVLVRGETVGKPVEFFRQNRRNEPERDEVAGGGEEFDVFLLMTGKYPVVHRQGQRKDQQHRAGKDVMQ